MEALIDQHTQGFLDALQRIDARKREQCEKQQETEETTAGTKYMQKKLWVRGLAVILTAYALLMSFLLLRWSGGTSATEQAKSLRIKKSTKR